ncbi:MAG: hypothetical protein WC917_02595 [Bacilli bacterium]|jgi:hypothetical protein
MNNYNKCDVCGIENENVVAGRWIFYCPEHKKNDWQKTYDNEISGVDDVNFDGELSEMILENL